MTAGHLVTDGDLTLLGYVYLGYLHHSVRKFVPDLDLVHLAFADGLLCLDGYAVVVDKVADQLVGLLVGGPLVGVDVVVVDALENFGRDLLVLFEDFDAVEVGYAGALLVLGEHDKLLQEIVVEFLGLAVVLCLTHLQPCLLVVLRRSLACGLLGDLCIEGGLDHGAAQRRIRFEGRVLDISRLVAEDGLEEFFLR